MTTWKRTQILLFLPLLAVWGHSWPVLAQEEKETDEAGAGQEGMNAEGDDDDSAASLDWGTRPAKEGVSMAAKEEAARSGATIAFEVIVERGESIFVFGCRPLQPEMFGEHRWETVPGPKCPGEGVAKELTPGTHELTLAATGRKRMLFRASLSYGVGCQPGVPLSAAHCRDFATAVSEQVRVTPSEEE